MHNCKLSDIAEEKEIAWLSNLLKQNKMATEGLNKDQIIREYRKHLNYWIKLVNEATK